MLRKNLLALFVLISSSFSTACRLPHKNTKDDTTASPLTLGSDGPAPAATLGYTMNHFALRVANLTASMHFYGEILGMRHIFTYAVTPSYTIAYMGYSHGGKNGTGYQTAAELLAEKSNIEGLIEFIYVANSRDDLSPATVKSNSFSHVGLIVPDITRAQARMEEYGVTILKRFGENPANTGPVAQAYGVTDESTAAVTLAGINALGFQYFLLVADPDGNLVEIQPQT